MDPQGPGTGYKLIKTSTSLLSPPASLFFELGSHVSQAGLDPFIVEGDLELLVLLTGPP